MGVLEPQNAACLCRCPPLPVPSSLGRIGNGQVLPPYSIARLPPGGAAPPLPPRQLPCVSDILVWSETATLTSVAEIGPSRCLSKVQMGVGVSKREKKRSRKVSRAGRSRVSKPTAGGLSISATMTKPAAGEFQVGRVEREDASPRGRCDL